MIEDGNAIAKAMGNNYSEFLIDKASLANQTALRYCSLWRATGQPAQAAIPGTTPAVPTKDTLGAIPFNNQTAPVKAYMAQLWGQCANNAQSLLVRDRLAQVGGLVLNVTTAQNITGMNLATLGVPADRLGAANNSDVEWYLEVYADGGATASNATINVTYDDDTTGNLNVLAVGGTIRAGNMFSLTPLIPTGSQGKFIKGINSVTLSASTTVAGNFGFTATRQRALVSLALNSITNEADWGKLAFPDIANNACLFLIMLPSTTSSGALRGGGKIIYG